MTDEQIIKALECCTTKGKSCKECPAFVKVDRSKCRQYFIAALELIKRQQEMLNRAIILPMLATEELKKELYDYCCERCVDEL